MAQSAWIGHNAPTLARLHAHGVDASQVEFDPPSHYRDWLAWFQQVDIVLDSFPGNGGLSLLDALWMACRWSAAAATGPAPARGVHPAPAGAGALGSGQRGGVCCRRAGLASDVPALCQIRTGLRARMQASPLLDGQRVARQIEQHCAAYLARHAPAPTGRRPQTSGARARPRELATWLDKADTRLSLPGVPAGRHPALSVVVILYNQAGLSLRTCKPWPTSAG